MYMPKDFEEKLDFDLYIKIVLNNMHSNMHINDHAKTSVNTMIHEVARKLCNRMGSLMRDNNKKTITTREVQTAVKLVLPSDLARHALNEGVRSLTRFAASASGTKYNHIPQAKRANIKFPPSRAKKLLKKYMPGSQRISVTAGIYFATMLEYLTAEIVELAGNAALNKMKKTISREHLMIAIKSDPELNILFKGTIAMDGYPQH